MTEPALIPSPVPRLRAAIVQCRTRVMRGRIIRISGTMIEAEVVGINDGRAFLTPIGQVAGLSSLAEVEPSERRLGVPVGMALLGRVLDGLGRMLDGPDDNWPVEATIPIDAAPPAPLARPPVSRLLPLGCRAIDGLMTCAEGQRIGIFGAAGAGKSRLIARIVQHAAADVFVVALVGERGREVGEFLEHTLGRAARARAVVV